MFIVLLYFSMCLNGIIIRGLQPVSDHVSPILPLAETSIAVTLETSYFWWVGQWHKLPNCGARSYRSGLKYHTRQNPDVSLFKSTHIQIALFV